MATRSDLLRRLRRLIDDVGNGYSQSAPRFLTQLTSTGFLAPSIDVQIDDEDRLTVELDPVSDLKTGTAIARSLQNSIRAADPALPNGLTEGFANCSVRFHREEGYVLRSGSIGSASRIHIWPATTGDDVSALLRLGANAGGYETEQQPEYSDQELEELLDAALEEQNASTQTAQWAYDTLPESYQTVVIYRAWASVVDIKLGRSANFFSQKVASEEADPSKIFSNFLRLAQWLKKRIDDLLAEVQSAIVVSTATVWDAELGGFVADNSYRPVENYCKILSIVPEADGVVLLEYNEILTPDMKKVFVAYSSTAGVWDRAALTATSFTDPGCEEPAGLGAGSTLERSITTTKNTLVRISGLTAGETYYFALQMTDQNGNRYFSNEIALPLPPAGP